MASEPKTVKISLGILIAIIALLACVGAIGGYIGSHINKTARIEVAPSSPNSSGTMIPVSQQITVSPGKLASDIAASKSKSIFLLVHKTAKGVKVFATGVAVTNDGIIASTQNGGTDPVFALGEDATLIEATQIGTDVLTGIHFFKLQNALINPIDVTQTMPKIGSTLLALSRSSVTISPLIQATVMSQIHPASADTPEGIQQIGAIQMLPSAVPGSAILDEDGKLAGLLLTDDGSSVLLAPDVAQAISRLSSNTLSYNPFTDLGFTINWSLQEDAQSHLGIKAVVQSVAPKSIASQGELKTGDIITAVNANTVSWDSNITNLLAGSQIQLTVLRNGVSTSITLAKQAS